MAHLFRFNAVQYGVTQHTFEIDYDQVLQLALEHKPKLIITGRSAIPRQINFAKFREITDEAGALLMVDMTHTELLPLLPIHTVNITAIIYCLK
ncbi:hypothetical protein [Psychromonas sp.]|uniref:hypothetical protein n=1 Tax=Psychromonas sp. TaxID=1884585 RepID=UPI003566AE9C